MPRSPIVYSPPPGTVPQQPLTPIPSAAWNGFVNDVTNTLNLPQPVEYGGTAGTTAISGHDGLTTKGANVATAATLNLDTATGAFVDLTGTTTVTAVTLSDGRHRMARAAGAFQITVGASLIGNAGGSNINVEFGDLIIFEGYSAGVVRFWVVRASGQSIVPSALAGHIFGLTTSNNTTDAVNDIDISTGSAASDAISPSLLTLSSALTKRLDAAWAVGNNNGGIDTGSKANSTWYHVWLIQRSDTGVVDVLFSLSASAPTLPTNYDRKRLIGSIFVNSSGTIRPFTQIGRTFLWRDAPALDISATSSTSGALYVISTPLNRVVRSIVRATLGPTAGAYYLSLYTPGTTVVSASPTAAPLPSFTSDDSGISGAEHRVITNSASQIGAVTSIADTLRLFAVGWDEV